MPPASANSRALQPLFLTYRFVAQDWLRARREPIPDSGFEEFCRNTLVAQLPGFRISQPREMRLGGHFATSSGILHEVDLVASRETLRIIWELKHWSAHVDKNAVIGFWAKLMDYLSATPDLAAFECIPVFVTTGAFDDHALAAALALGIEPVAPGLRSPLILAHNLRLLESGPEDQRVFVAQSEELIQEFRLGCNRLAAMLSGASLSDRVGRLSDKAISVAARTVEDGVAAGDLLRKLNARWNEIRYRWESQKGSFR